MGWNSLTGRESQQKINLFQGLAEHPYVYFVHSYHAVPAEPEIITATTEYGETLTAAVAKGNVQATQFHPEKSGDVGLRILKNFVRG
jgi:glutamine amidotransferase